MCLRIMDEMNKRNEITRLLPNPSDLVSALCFLSLCFPCVFLLGPAHTSTNTKFGSHPMFCLCSGPILDHSDAPFTFRTHYSSCPCHSTFGACAHSTSACCRRRRPSTMPSQQCMCGQSQQLLLLLIPLISKRRAMDPRRPQHLPPQTEPPLKLPSIPLASADCGNTIPHRSRRIS